MLRFYNVMVVFLSVWRRIVDRPNTRIFIQGNNRVCKYIFTWDIMQMFTCWSISSLSLDIGKLTKSLDISVCVLCDSLLPLTCWYHSFSFWLNMSSSAFTSTGPFKRSNSFCYLNHLYQLPSPNIIFSTSMSSTFWMWEI